MKNDPIYMEARALEFIRSWPDVPQTLRPVYSRFYDAKLLWIDPNVDRPGGSGADWPGALRLTERGQALKEIVDAQSFNFFTVDQIKPILADGDLSEKERRIFKDDIPGAKLLPALRGVRSAMERLNIALERLDRTLNGKAYYP